MLLSMLETGMICVVVPAMYKNQISFHPDKSLEDHEDSLYADKSLDSW